MTEAEIIAIGTELLLGEIPDTNSQFIASKLREAGIDLHRVTIVGDNKDRISQAIRESLARADIIITCGGLGPTVDDPTREAVAQAMDVPLDFSDDLWQQISIRYQRMNRKITDNNRRQAYIPRGSIPFDNPVGTAPCFILNKNGKTITSLPGVPHEMEYIFTHSTLPELMKELKKPSFIKKTVLHTTGISESQIDELIGDLEEQPNPTVGLAAHPGEIDIRITAKAKTQILAEKMITKTRAIIDNRLKNSIYGADDESLVDIVLKELQTAEFSLCLREYGLKGELSKFLRKMGLSEFSSQVIEKSLTLQDLKKEISKQSLMDHQLLLGVSLIEETSCRVLVLILRKRNKIFTNERFFGDLDSPLFPLVANIVLDYIHRHMEKDKL